MTVCAPRSPSRPGCPASTRHGSASGARCSSGRPRHVRRLARPRQGDRPTGAGGLGRPLTDRTAGKKGFSAYLDLLAADHAARFRRIPADASPSLRRRRTKRAGDLHSVRSPKPAPKAAAGQRHVARKRRPHGRVHAGLAGRRRCSETAAVDRCPERFADPDRPVREDHATAGEPRQLRRISMRQLEFYPGGPFHEQAVTGAADSFRRHLGPRGALLGPNGASYSAAIASVRHAATGKAGRNIQLDEGPKGRIAAPAGAGPSVSST